MFWDQRRGKIIFEVGFQGEIHEKNTFCLWDVENISFLKIFSDYYKLGLRIAKRERSFTFHWGKCVEWIWVNIKYRFIIRRGRIDWSCRHTYTTIGNDQQIQVFNGQLSSYRITFYLDKKNSSKTPLLITNEGKINGRKKVFTKKIDSVISRLFSNKPHRKTEKFKFTTQFQTKQKQGQKE